MGVVTNITHEKFPKQSGWIGRTISVCFHYNASVRVRGVVVRDDMEEPNVMIIQLDNGRVILSTECQYVPLDAER